MSDRKGQVLLYSKCHEGSALKIYDKFVVK